MKRLLIIDDEAIIVEGLYEFFAKQTKIEWEVLKAYSVEEALTIMDEMKVDVALSDICMPEMDGMDLLRQIETRWPRCKVIFLTGHSEFEYAQAAIRSPAVVDYILKRENKAVILDAVEQAFHLAEEEMARDNQLHWLSQLLPKAAPKLQQQLLMQAVNDPTPELMRTLPAQFEMLRIRLRAQEPVLPVVALVEDWGKYATESDRGLIRYAIVNIAEELLGRQAAMCGLETGNSAMLFLIQRQIAEETRHYGPGGRIVRFAHGMLESIQQCCRDFLGIALSTAVLDRCVAWTELRAAQELLKVSIFQSLGAGMEKLIVVDGSPQRAELRAFREVGPAIREAMDDIRASLLRADKEEFAHRFKAFCEQFAHTPASPLDLHEILSTLAKDYLFCLGEAGLKAEASKKANLLTWLQQDRTVSWAETLEAYRQSALWLMERRQEGRQYGPDRMLTIIHDFIQTRLDDDLSLTRIAREVSLNPSYLSRWYKQVTGLRLSEHIVEARLRKAKELLSTTQLRIHDISARLGFTDQHYFFRFFKRLTGSTPHEYREQTTERTKKS